MANEAVVILCMMALLVGGVAMAINLPAMFGIPLGLGLGDIRGVTSGFWIIVVRLVGVILAGISIYVIKGIITS